MCLVRFILLNSIQPLLNRVTIHHESADQISADSAGTKLIRLQDAISQGINVAGLFDAGKHTHKKPRLSRVSESAAIKECLFIEGSESSAHWFAPPGYTAKSDASPANSYARIPINLPRYESVGIVLGLAMYNGVLCHPYFPLCMMKLLLRPLFAGEKKHRSLSAEEQYNSLNPNLRDLRALHPTLAASLEQLLGLDAETIDSLDLYFEASRSVPVFFAGSKSAKQVNFTEPLLRKNVMGAAAISASAPPEKVSKLNVHEYVVATCHISSTHRASTNTKPCLGVSLDVVELPALALCCHMTREHFVRYGKH